MGALFVSGDHLSRQRQAQDDPEAPAEALADEARAVRGRGRGPPGARRRNSSCARASTWSPISSTRSARSGSGTRVIGVYKQRWAEPRATCSCISTASRTRATWARSSAPRTRSPTPRWCSVRDSADPYSPKARPGVDGLDLRAAACARDARRTRRPQGRPRCDTPSATLRDLDVTAPVVLGDGVRAGRPSGAASRRARIPVHADSLNVAMAATVALYEVANRMAARWLTWTS